MKKRTRRGQRSKQARQRRHVNRLVRENSFEDLQLGESINLLDPRQIRQALEQKFGYAHVGSSQKFEKGEVLSNKRGEGSLIPKRPQKGDDLKQWMFDDEDDDE